MRRSFVLRNTPEEWNTRFLTEADFYRYCDEGNIVLHEDRRLAQPGLYLVYDNKAHIFIDERLRGFVRLLVGFHELAHFWMHPVGVKLFQGVETNAETEADVVATCALIPRPIIEHVSPDRICGLYGYPRSLVELRLKILGQWKL